MATAVVDDEYVVTLGGLDETPPPEPPPPRIRRRLAGGLDPRPTKLLNPGRLLVVVLEADAVDDDEALDADAMMLVLMLFKDVDDEELDRRCC